MAYRTDKNLRAGLYARVSTEDRGQDPETQLRPLREYAERRGFAVVGEFVDKASGTTESRPSYQRLLEAVRQGELVFGMMANLAQFESALIGERVKAGMARAKAQGKRTSRLPIPEATRRKIAELHAQGVSIKRIAKELKVAYGTVWNYVNGTN